MSFAITKLYMRGAVNLRQVRREAFSRNYNNRKNCKPYKGPRCTKENLAEQPPCSSKVRRLDAHRPLVKKNTMWENPECCVDNCPNYYPRFDELYYKSSDKTKRKYQQTWHTCPALIIQPRKVCSFDQLDMTPPEHVRRERKDIPKTACPQGGSKLCLVIDEVGKCPKIKVFGCQDVRSPPKCESERRPMLCEKECTPYPSFSECMRNEAAQKHPSECKCICQRVMCDVWAEMRRRMAFVK